MRKIIFDEISYAENLLEMKYWEKIKTQNADIMILSKYYRHIGVPESQILEKVLSVCLEKVPYFNSVTQKQRVKNIVYNSRKYNILKVNRIDIYKSELDKIREVKDYDKQKVLFVMLVLAKAKKFDLANTRYAQHHGYYVSRDLDDFVIELSGIPRYRLNKKKLAYLYHELKELGFVKHTFFDSHKILYESSQGDIDIIIRDFDNIISYYLDYTDGELLYCEICGKEFPKMGRKRHKFCEGCREARHRESSREGMRKMRSD